MTDLIHLGACDLAARIRAGQVKPSEVMSAHLTRIAQTNTRDEVFQFNDPSLAMIQAQLADAMPATGPLHGVPFAIMDTINTRGMPTSWGTQLYSDRVPERNAACVDAFLSAGAVPIGKTKTAAFAIGDSPNGAATAVANRVATFALCSGAPPATDVVVFKPTRGSYNLRGIMTLSESLDTLCILARDPQDFKVALPAICGFEGEGSVSAEPRIGYLQGARFNELPQAVATTRRAVQEVAQFPLLGSLPQTQATIFAYEIARFRAAEAALGPARVGQPICDLVTTGANVSETTYSKALDQWRDAHDRLDDILKDIDVLLAPGDQTHWRWMNHPCVTLPGGLQIMGRQGQDTQLLDVACRFFERTQATT
ncbi:amidase [Tropicibacter sp. R16_0]|uniref:amidase n=1 Tax=Tropicibacter sp. R16_0 TaxID=2821102 RepID=UPI001AD97452|nr:amidase family protein [Tropicibacter sp. R16_0]MBO9451114.1 amidase [Tropicibacter sp. R16_0]